MLFSVYFRPSRLPMLQFDVDVRDDARAALVLKITNHAPQSNTNHVAVVNLGAEFVA